MGWLFNVVVTLGLWAGLGLGTESPQDGGFVPEDMWNVFGEDDRVPLTSQAYPWKTIGKLTPGCTATLVGPDLILTAAHCILDSETEEVRSNLAFYPNQIAGKARHSSSLLHIWLGTKTPNSDRAADWAIGRLKKPLGDTYGWMGVSASSNATKATLAGYSANFRRGQTAGVHIGCNIRQTFSLSALFLHDCDMGPGASGGPLFVMEEDKPFIIGVNVAERRGEEEGTLHLPEYSAERANLGVSSSAFIKKLTQLRNLAALEQSAQVHSLGRAPVSHIDAVATNLDDTAQED